MRTTERRRDAEKEKRQNKVFFDDERLFFLRVRVALRKTKRRAPSALLLQQHDNDAGASKTRRLDSTRINATLSTLSSTRSTRSTAVYPRLKKSLFANERANTSRASHAPAPAVVGLAAHARERVESPALEVVHGDRHGPAVRVAGDAPEPVQRELAHEPAVGFLEQTQTFR